MYFHILVSWPDGDPGWGVETSCDAIKLFAKCVMVVTENIDRCYIKFFFASYVKATACHLFGTEARAHTHKHTH